MSQPGLLKGKNLPGKELKPDVRFGTQMIHAYNGDGYESPASAKWTAPKHPTMKQPEQPESTDQMTPRRMRTP